MYDQTVIEQNWPYKLSTEVKNTSKNNAGNVRNQGLPWFSSEAFLEYLVQFIVADDQVSPVNLAFFLALTHPQSIHVVECPEFQQLCMILRKSLTEKDIPHRDKMREAIIYRWKMSFEELKGELLVSLYALLFIFLLC